VKIAIKQKPQKNIHGMNNSSAHSSRDSLHKSVKGKKKRNTTSPILLGIWWSCRLLFFSTVACSSGTKMLVEHLFLAYSLDGLHSSRTAVDDDEILGLSSM
jgi:hypothetical protein